MSEIAKMLDHLGFDAGSIVEAIVASWNLNKTPNAAPMGVIRTASELIEIRPFKTSSTYRNLLNDKEACINVTEDPEAYFVTAFKNELPPSFETAEIDDKLSMKGSDACIFIEVKDRRSISEEREAFTCRVKTINVNCPIPKVFSRGRAEAIEAIIHATRIEEYLKKGLSSDVERLNIRVSECKEVVDRVSSSDSKEARVMRALMGMIEGWRETASRSL